MNGSPGKPTIVLVHGAFAGSSSWDDVVSLLLDDGYPVRPVANPLRGVARDSAYLAGVLDGLHGDLVLVGHSYGGILISNAATGDDRVRALVFVGAFAPEAGETAAALAGRYEGGTLGQTLVTVDLPDGDSNLYIAQDRYRAQFAADLPDRQAATMAATQRPMVGAALDEPSGEPAWKTIPSWFLCGSADRNIPAAAHRFMAERARPRRTVEIPGASHAVAVSGPAAVAELIREAADQGDGLISALGSGPAWHDAAFRSPFRGFA